MNKLIRVLCACALLTLWATHAVAAEGDKAGEKTAKEGGEEVTPELQMQEVEIRGELERPDVFYIIPRRKATMDLGVLSKDYKEAIMEPLLPGHFEKVHGTKAK